jgi:hypothetical protein
MMIDRRQPCSLPPQPPPRLPPRPKTSGGLNVIDIHAHTRNDVNGNAAHCDSAGISHAILLTRASGLDAAKAAQAASRTLTSRL